MNIILLAIGFMFFVIILFRIVEPAYLLLFNKPLFIHWYIFPKKLKPIEKQFLADEFPFYKRLSDRKKVYFEHRINQFITKYQFIGKEIVVTPPMKLLISGTYVMLTFGMRNFLIDLFDKIIIYPSSYFSTVNDAQHKGEFNPKMKAIVFSWEDFLLGQSVSNDNINLGLHEFSHALHFHCLKSNDPSAIVFYDEFTAVCQYFTNDILSNELKSKAYFRSYAYVNQFEFLSVILEHFFETPYEFKVNHPQLFDHVATMINFDEQL